MSAFPGKGMVVASYNVKGRIPVIFCIQILDHVVSELDLSQFKDRLFNEYGCEKIESFLEIKDLSKRLPMYVGLDGYPNEEMKNYFAVGEMRGFLDTGFMFSGLDFVREDDIPEDYEYDGLY
jgi:hypothetical protein